MKSINRDKRTKINDAKLLFNNLKTFKIDSGFFDWDFFVLYGVKRQFDSLNVGELARKEADKWINFNRFNGNISLIIIDATLSANINYKTVVNTLRKFYIRYKDVNLKELSEIDPIVLSKQMGFNAERWKATIDASKIILEHTGGEIDSISAWCNGLAITDNPLMSISGIGLATSQYLKMQMGVDTIKPDRRVKFCLSKYLNLDFSNDYEVIKICHLLARELNIRPIELDMVLWYAYPMIKAI